MQRAVHAQNLLSRICEKNFGIKNFGELRLMCLSMHIALIHILVMKQVRVCASYRVANKLWHGVSTEMLGSQSITLQLPTFFIKPVL